MHGRGGARTLYEACCHLDAGLAAEGVARTHGDRRCLHALRASPVEDPWASAEDLLASAYRSADVASWGLLARSEHDWYRRRTAAPGDHTPRISFGPLVVCRESWRFGAGELGFAEMADERARYLSRAVRKTAGGATPVRVTEMLPTPDQMWLVDRDGRRYASELRIVTVEPGAG